MNTRTQPAITRILMTADAVGGVWAYTLELSRALRELGIQVDIALMGPSPSPGQREACAKLDNCFVYEKKCRLEWMDEPWDDVDAAGTWLLDLESRLRPDVVHLNGFAHGALPWKAPVLIVGHSCVFSWYKAVKGYIPYQKYSVYRDAVTHGLRSGKAVTAPSAAMLDALKTHYGPFSAAAPVYNGRDASDWIPRLKKPLILSAGRLWDEAKNITALSRIARQIPWPVFAAGDTRGPDGEHRRPDGITCLGRLAPEILCQWMGHASLYVLPARYEPFGLSVLEAALAGCALVLGDIPSLRELWNGAAFFVPPEDSSALLEAITVLIDDRSLREELAAKARQRATVRTPRRMAGTYYSLYKNLAYRGAHPGCPRQERAS